MSICLPAGLRCLVTEEERREKQPAGEKGGRREAGALVTRSPTLVLTQRDITVQLFSELSLCERNDELRRAGSFFKNKMF